MINNFCFLNEMERASGGSVKLHGSYKYDGHGMWEYMYRGNQYRPSICRIGSSITNRTARWVHSSRTICLWNRMLAYSFNKMSQFLGPIVVFVLLAPFPLAMWHGYVSYRRHSEVRRNYPAFSLLLLTWNILCVFLSAWCFILPVIAKIISV